MGARDDTGLENAHILRCETGYELVPLVNSLKSYFRFCFSQNCGRKKNPKKHFTERRGKMSCYGGAKSLKLRCFPAQYAERHSGKNLYSRVLTGQVGFLSLKLRGIIFLNLGI